GLGVVRLIEDLFARSEEFGFLGLALAVVAAVALLVVVIREAMGLARLATLVQLPPRARRPSPPRARSGRSRAACRGSPAAAPQWRAILAISSTAPTWCGSSSANSCRRWISRRVALLPRRQRGCRRSPRGGRAPPSAC